MNTDHENAQSGKICHTPRKPHCIDEHSRQYRAHELSTILHSSFSEILLHKRKPVDVCSRRSCLPHGVNCVPVAGHGTSCRQITGYAVLPEGNNERTY